MCWDSCSPRFPHHFTGFFLSLPCVKPDFPGFKSQFSGIFAPLTPRFPHHLSGFLLPLASLDFSLPLPWFNRNFPGFSCPAVAAAPSPSRRKMSHGRLRGRRRRRKNVASPENLFPRKKPNFSQSSSLEKERKERLSRLCRPQTAPKTLLGCPEKDPPDSWCIKIPLYLDFPGAGTARDRSKIWEATGELKRRVVNAVPGGSAPQKARTRTLNVGLNGALDHESSQKP